MPRPGDWKALFEGPDALRFHAGVDLVREDLSHLALGRQPDAIVGRTLLEAYTSLTRNEDAATTRAMESLSEGMDAISEVPLPPILYGGSLGVAWLLEHLSSRLFEPDEDLNGETDVLLRELLAIPRWRGHYDLISGIVGVAVYATERRFSSAGVGLLEAILRHLSSIAVEMDGGITWHTPPELLPLWQRQTAPEGYYNLGVAHGVPGILAILATAIDAGVNEAEARRLLRGGVDWLLRQRMAHHPGGSFPAWVVPGAPTHPTRSSWCYGDLGISVALLRAATALDDDTLRQAAIEIAQQSAAIGVDDSGVMDAGLCHGAAGNGHLFNRLYQATGVEDFRAAAVRWLENALAHQQPGTGIGGFTTWEKDPPDGPESRRDDPGFLGGAPGTALALLAAVSHVEPVWDRLLLMDVPPAVS
jgi:class I lanthipeptide synthase